MNSFELQIFIMKQTFYSALLAIPLFFIQCSKSKTVDNNLPQPGTDPFANCLVTETNRDGFQPHYFNYDAQKRLVRHQYSDYENILTYSGNTVINTQTYSGAPHYKRTIVVNAQGFATNIRVDYPNGTWTNEAYEYDAGRLIRKSTHTNSNATLKHTTYQWVDGNMVAETAPDGDITSYTFNTAELFQQGENAGIGELEVGYKTVRNKNRVKTIKSPSGTITTYGYSEDSDGKIVRKQVTSTSGANYAVTNTYKCN